MSHLEAKISSLERDSKQLNDLFQCIINDMKGSTVIWEDFSNKAAKLHFALRSTIVVITPFLDAFQKIADLASGSRGATRDIGIALTRLCVRHRGIETKLRAFVGAITDTVVEPLRLKLEEWKKTTAQMDREHTKECKKMQHEIKKASSDTLRLQKQTKKGQDDFKLRLDNAMLDVHKKHVMLEEVERQAVRSAMIEERSRFCSFLSFLKPFMEQEIAMFSEFTHLQEIVELLLEQTADPTSLPQACEQVISDLKISNEYPLQEPPHFSSASISGSQMGSYRSSTCSINSSSSCYSQSLGNSCHSGSQILDSQATVTMQEEGIHLKGRDDSSFSDFSSLSTADSHSVTSLNLASAFPPAPPFLESSEFLQRTNTMPYGHSRSKRVFSTFESKARQENALNATPSNFQLNGNLGNNGLTDQFSEIAENCQFPINICSKPLIHEVQKQDVAIHQLTSSPSVFVKTQQTFSTDSMSSGSEDQKESSQLRPVCRSFSFPTQTEPLEDLDSSGPLTRKDAQLPVSNMKQGFGMTMDITDLCNDGTKPLTLPRMPSFKVPLVPKCYSSSLSGKSRPPTLPKRTSSKLCSVKPSFSSSHDAIVSKSSETISSNITFKTNSSNLPSRSDIAEIQMTTKECDDELDVMEQTNDDESKCSRNFQPKSCHNSEVDESHFSTSSFGSPFSLRQQAPPTEEVERLHPLCSQPATVIPLMEEVLEFSVCSIQSPVHDNKITKPDGNLCDDIK